VPRLELLPVGAIADPITRPRDPLPRRDRGRVADDHCEISVAAPLDPQHTEARLGIVEGDARDDASEHFAVVLI